MKNARIQLQSVTQFYFSRFLFVLFRSSLRSIFLPACFCRLTDDSSAMKGSLVEQLDRRNDDVVVDEWAI